MLDFTPNQTDGIPAQIPQWLLFSGVSPQAVMLYGIFHLSLYRNGINSSGDQIPMTREFFSKALRLDDVDQVDGIYQELVGIGAIEDCFEPGEDGVARRVMIVHGVSPDQREREEERKRKLKEVFSVAKSKPPGNIYVIREVGGGLTKIGFSRDVKKRHEGLQGSNPNLLELLWHTPGDLKLEGALHWKFKKYRVRGEWYDFGKLDPVKAVSRAVDQIRARTSKTVDSRGSSQV